MLSVFTVEGAGGGRALAPLPDRLSGGERDEIVEGCCEALLILADAEAGSPPRGAVRRPPGRWRSSTRPPGSRRRWRGPGPITYAGPPAWPHWATSPAPIASGPRPPGWHRPGRSTISSTAGSCTRKAAWPRPCPNSGPPSQTEPGHFWARCLLAITDLRVGRPDRGPDPPGQLPSGPPGPPAASLAWLLILRGYAHGQVGALALGPVASLGPSEPPAALDEDGDDVPAPARDEPTRGRLGRRLRGRRGRLPRRPGGPRPGRSRPPLVPAGLPRTGPVPGGRRLDEAAADFEEALRIHPGKVDAQVNLAGVYLRQGRTARAVDRLTRAIEQDPGRAELASALRFRAYIHVLGRRPRPASSRSPRGPGPARPSGRSRCRRRRTGRGVAGPGPRESGRRPRSAWPWPTSRRSPAGPATAPRTSPPTTPGGPSCCSGPAASPRPSSPPTPPCPPRRDSPGPTDGGPAPCSSSGGTTRRSAPPTPYLARNRPSAELLSIRGRAHAARTGAAPRHRGLFPGPGPPARPGHRAGPARLGLPLLRDPEARRPRLRGGPPARPGPGRGLCRPGERPDPARPAPGGPRRRRGGPQAYGERSHLTLYRCARIYAQAADAEFVP